MKRKDLFSVEDLKSSLIVWTRELYNSPDWIQRALAKERINRIEKAIARALKGSGFARF